MFASAIGIAEFWRVSSQGIYEKYYYSRSSGRVLFCNLQKKKRIAECPNWLGDLVARLNFMSQGLRDEHFEREAHEHGVQRYLMQRLEKGF